MPAYGANIVGLRTRATSEELEILESLKPTTLDRIAEY